MRREIPLERSPPTTEDAVSILERLNSELKQQDCDIDKLNVELAVGM